MTGRPKGCKDKTPRNTLTRRMNAVRALAGEMPLDVMLLDMRHNLDAFREHEASDLPLARQHLTLAADRARDAAPYCHSKLSALRTAPPQLGDPALASDADLYAIATGLVDPAEGGGGDADAEDDPA